MAQALLLDCDTMTEIAPSLANLYAPIRDELIAVERAFDEELLSDVWHVQDLCDRVRSYRGKMLRPALLLLCGKATGKLTGAHTTLAAVAEIVHVATLIHDDVLDAADHRRRRPTFRSTNGNVAAVLLGDYLISHAFHLCSGLDSQYASRRIGATTNAVCEGELLQNHMRGDDQLDESHYLDIVQRKTGSLTAVCCELGAFYSGAGDLTVSAMFEFGMSAGVAYQIIDDVLDIVGDQHQVGKTLGRDLELGKLTLPTIHCLANADAATASVLRSAVRGEVPCNRSRLRKWLDTTGSIEYAVREAMSHVQEALRQLDRLPEGDAKASLSAMAEFLVERHF